MTKKALRNHHRSLTATRVCAQPPVHLVREEGGNGFDCATSWLLIRRTTAARSAQSLRMILVDKDFILLYFLIEAGGLTLVADLRVARRWRGSWRRGGEDANTLS